MKLHEEWLYKAENDLKSSKILYQSNKDLLDICAYHSQQCAEKSLKAFLVYKKQEIDKTHNLISLIAQCKVFDIDFENLINEAVFLNPFSTQYRYPEGGIQPSKNETETSIIHAEKIYSFVKEKVIS